MTILREFQGIDRTKFLSDHLIYSTVERDLQLAAECVFDIGNHIIAEMGFREPEGYRDIIVILGEEGVLPNDFTERFADLAGFRNVLVHEYLDVDRNQVYDVLRDELDDFRRFAEYVVAYLFGGERHT